MIQFNQYLIQTFIVKSPNFRIKCFRKIERKFSHNSDIDIEMYDKDGQDAETVDQANNPKNDKFTTKELIFALQIYAVILFALVNNNIF